MAKADLSHDGMAWGLLTFEVFSEVMEAKPKGCGERIPQALYCRTDRMTTR